MKLDTQCFRAINDYINIRYSHWELRARRDRKRAIIKKLKTESDAVKQKYIEDVNNFLKINGLKK